MVIDSISHRIFKYIKLNDLDSIKSISDNGDYLREINDLDYPGYSPVDLAVEFGFTNIVSYLIQQGADVNFSNISSPLHFAVCSGNTEIAKYLLDAGADLEFEIDDGRTPLMGAICSDSFDMVLLLVESGANIFAEDRNGCSILHLAFMSTNEEITKYITSFYINNGRNIDYLFECVQAIRQGNLKIVKRLIENNSVQVNSIDNEGWPLLSIAAFYAQQNIVKLLIELGANKEQHTESGKTALMIAAKEQNAEIVKVLVESQCNIHAQEPVHGYTPLMFAISSSAYTHSAQVNRLATVEQLLKLGANPSMFNFKGKSAIDIAQQKGDPELIDLLQYFVA